MTSSGFDKLTAGIQDNIKGAFGEDAEYEPKKGGSISIVGVFNDKFLFVDPQTQQVVSSQQPTFGVKLSDLGAPPAKGDGVTIRGKKYLVHDSQEDGEGWLNLFLHEV